MDITVIIKLVIVIAVLLILVFKKIKPEIALTVCSLLLLLIYGKGLKGIADAFLGFVRDGNTWSLPAAVILIGILGGVMGKTGMLQRMVDDLKPMAGSTKWTILLTPLIIGLLSVTGGAYISCPMVDELGNTLKLAPERKAAINLVYRHAVFFSYPLSGTTIVIAQLSGVDVGKICLVDLPMVVLVLVAGYFIFLRDIEDVKLQRAKGKEFFLHLKGFFINFLPILVPLILAVAFKLPMVISVAAGIIIALALIYLGPGKKPEQDIFSLLFKKVNYKMLLVVFAALFFKAAVSSVGEIAVAMRELAASGLPVELIIVIIGFITSFPTGSIQAPAAIILPIILTFPLSETELLLCACLTLCVGMFGYFFSPVHMCQILTLEYFHATLPKLMKEYRYFIPVFAVGIAVWYTAAKLLLL